MRIGSLDLIFFNSYFLLLSLYHLNSHYNKKAGVAFRKNCAPPRVMELIELLPRWAPITASTE